MKKLLIIAAVLAVCAGVWFICSREKAPAAAETQAAPAAEAERAAAFVSEFRAVLAANDHVEMKTLATIRNRGILRHSLNCCAAPNCRRSRNGSNSAPPAATAGRSVTRLTAA